VRLCSILTAMSDPSPRSEQEALKVLGATGAEKQRRGNLAAGTETPPQISATVDAEKTPQTDALADAKTPPHTAPLPETEMLPQTAANASDGKPVGPPQAAQASSSIQSVWRRSWRKIVRVAGFLAAAGLLSVPVTVLIDWLKQDAPTLVTELSCEVADAPSDGQAATIERVPPLDPTQPITVSVGERLICGVDQEGGEFIVWRGGGNGFTMRSGPIRPTQEVGWLERARLIIQPPAKPQTTACVSDESPAAGGRQLPTCRHAISYSAPGLHALTVRVSKRGSPYVEELSLPIRAVESQTVLRLQSIEIVPPAGSRNATRAGSFSETLNAPGGLLAPSRVEVRRIPVVQAAAGETIVTSTARLSVHSSNGASASIEETPTTVFVVLNLRSGPGFDKRRAWIAGEVTAMVRSQVNLAPIIVGRTILRVPGRRQVYDQPVTEGSELRVKFEDGQTEVLQLGAWSSGSRVRFVRTEGGLAVDVK
jgi:hypothetical protein